MSIFYEFDGMINNFSLLCNYLTGRIYKYKYF